MAEFNARDYLVRNVLSSASAPLPNLEGVCTQVDHETAHLRRVIKEAFDDLRNNDDVGAYAILANAQQFLTARGGTGDPEREREREAKP